MFPYYIIIIIGLVVTLMIGGNKKNDVLLATLFLCLALFVGFGDMLGGYDRYIYGEAFEGIADSLRNGRGLESMLYLVNGNEYGYFYWQALVGLFTPNRYIYILITTLFIYVLYFFAFKRYINDFPLALVVF